MAIGAPAQRAIGEPTAQTTTTVITPGTNIASGSLAVLTCTANAAKVISSVADSVGNTWVVDKTASDGTRTISFASAQVATQITTANTITITWSVATSGNIVYWVHEVASAATSSAFDTFNSGTGTGTALATGSTATLAQADELVFGCFRTTGSGAGWTKGASYTNPTTPQSTTNPGSALEYKIVAATTAVLADGTWSASGTWIGLCVTYKGASGATTYNQSVTGALSFAGLDHASTARALPGALSFAGVTPVFAMQRRLAGTLTPTSTLVRAMTRTLTSAALSFSGSVSRVVTRTLTAAALSFSGSLSRALPRSVTAALSFAGALTPRSLARLLAAAFTPSGTLNLRTTRLLAAALTPVGALSRAGTRILTGALSFAGSVAGVKVTILTQFLSGVFTPSSGQTYPGDDVYPDNNLYPGADPILFRLNRALSAVLSSSGSMTSQRHNITLSGILAPLATLSKNPRRTLTAALSSTGSLATRLSVTTLKLLTASLQAAGSLHGIPVDNPSGGGGWGSPMPDAFFMRYKPTLRRQKVKL